MEAGPARDRCAPPDRRRTLKISCWLTGSGAIFTRTVLGTSECSRIGSELKPADRIRIGRRISVRLIVRSSRRPRCTVAAGLPRRRQRRGIVPARQCRGSAQQSVRFFGTSPVRIPGSAARIRTGDVEPRASTPALGEAYGSLKGPARREPPGPCPDGTRRPGDEAPLGGPRARAPQDDGRDGIPVTRGPSRAVSGHGARFAGGLAVPRPRRGIRASGPPTRYGRGGGAVGRVGGPRRSRRAPRAGIRAARDRPAGRFSALR